MLIAILLNIIIRLRRYYADVDSSLQFVDDVKNFELDSNLSRGLTMTKGTFLWAALLVLALLVSVLALGWAHLP
jgi:hypothetical protein